MKRFLYSLIIIISAILFSGCADIQYRRIYSEGGSIIDELVIKLDPSKFDDTTLANVDLAIREDILSYKNKVDNWIQQNFFPNSSQSFALYNYIKDGIKVSTVMPNSVNRYKYMLITEFASLSHFGIFYGQTKVNGEIYEAIQKDLGPFLVEFEGKPYESVNPFVYKYSSVVSENVLDSFENVQKDETTTYLNRYLETVLNNVYSKSQILQEIEIQQIFETTDKRVKSNATIVDDGSIQGFTKHIWNINQMGAEGELEIYKHTANTVTWYYWALIISLGVILGLEIYSHSKKIEFIKVKKNKENIIEVGYGDFDEN